MILHFRDLLIQLINGQVDFILVCGMAGAIHGSSLLTQDIDILCDMNPRNIRKLWQSLKKLQPKHRMARPPCAFEASDCDRTWKNISLLTDWGQQDCLGSVKAVGSYKDARPHTIQIPLGDEKESPILLTLDLPTLIQAKEAMGRPHDLENVKILGQS
ncbi:MAG: hypothetical protein ACPGN3_01010 [Opitutales bacterium]